MTRVTLVCKTCGFKVRRDLSFEPGSRGVHETSSEPARCPRGHGPMAREDGVPQEDWATWSPSAPVNADRAMITPQQFWASLSFDERLDVMLEASLTTPCFTKFYGPVFRPPTEWEAELKRIARL